MHGQGTDLGEENGEKAAEFFKEDGKLLVVDDVFASMLCKKVPDAESSRPFHLNSSLNEVGQTLLGGLFKTQIVKAFKTQMGSDSADPTVEKMFEEMANDMPLRSLVLFSQGKIGFKSMRVLLALLNNRFVDAIKELLAQR